MSAKFDYRWLEVRGGWGVGVRGGGVGAAAAPAEPGVAPQPVAFSFADAGGAAGVAQATQKTHCLYARAASLPWA